MNLQTSRRALLGSLALAPITGAAIAIQPGSASSERIEWDRLVAAFEKARTASRTYDQQYTNPMMEELDRRAPAPQMHFGIATNNAEAFRRAVAKRQAELDARVAAQIALRSDAIHGESERLCDAECEAERLVRTMPAPDLEALLYKLELHFGEEVREGGDCPIWAGHVLDAIMTDARRLLCREARA